MCPVRRDWEEDFPVVQEKVETQVSMLSASVATRGPPRSRGVSWGKQPGQLQAHSERLRPGEVLTERGALHVCSSNRERRTKGR